MKKPDCHILVFAKAPIPGEIKTRLFSFMDPETATALHKKLVFHTLNVAMESKSGSVELWCAPLIEHPFFFLGLRQNESTLFEGIS